MRYAMIAALVLVGGCDTATTPRTTQMDVAWTKSPATMTADEFLLATTEIEFVRDPAHGVQPGHVIEPEAAVNHFDPSHPPQQEGQGRFMARIIDGSDVVYWWANPNTHESLWLSPTGSVLARGDFKYCDHGQPSARPDAAFNMIHPASWQCTVPIGLDHIGRIQVGNQSWVSCGGGCCNGAIH